MGADAFSLLVSIHSPRPFACILVQRINVAMARAIRKKRIVGVDAQLTGQTQLKRLPA